MIFDQARLRIVDFLKIRMTNQLWEKYFVCLIYKNTFSSVLHR